MLELCCTKGPLWVLFVSLAVNALMTETQVGIFVYAVSGQ